jgi:hypothetical protein
VAPNPPASSPPAAGPPAPAPPSGSIVDEVTGDYTLRLELGSGCAVIPETDRTRNYTATITSPRERNYVVSLTSGNFLGGLICTAYPAGLGCDQFTASRDEDLIRFDLANNNDDAHGGHIVERLSSGTWVEIIGSAAGRLQGTTIEAVGTTSVWYCPTSLPYPFPCFSFTGCKSSDTKFTFTRQ